MLINRFARLAGCTALLVALIACQPSENPESAVSTASGDANPAPAEGASVEWPDITSEVKKDPAIEARIDELLAQMTLEEKDRKSVV